MDAFFEKLLSEAQAENVEAQYNLGICYEKGIGVPQDYAEAVKWYTKAAEQGNIDAQNRIRHPKISHIKDQTSDMFMSALQGCRASQNRTICKYNDRGHKVSYFQTFEYELDKILVVTSTFQNYDSVYKNYCLYVVINKLCNAEVMLLQPLKGICEHRYDIFRNESDCWAGAMCALKIIDLYYLTNTLTEDDVSIIKLCLLLLNIYIKYHFNEDQLRIMECYANRSRLNERLYKKSYFFYAVSAYSDRFMANPFLTKYLCMYDLDQAKILTPHEFVGEYAENYNYFASQLMMYQNQGLGAVLPEGGDPFDDPFNDVIKVGESMANEINNKLEYMIWPIFDDFKSKYDICLTKLRKEVDSYYQRVNKGNDDKLTNICCFSWAHQLESYSYFGMAKAKFIPIKYQLKDFLQSVQIDNDKIEGPSKGTFGKKYLIHEFNKYPKMVNSQGKCPFINSLLICTDDEDNIKVFRCYGQDFKDWIKDLQWYHLFFGVAVRPLFAELYRLPETVNLMVCFQIENDINLK